MYEVTFALTGRKYTSKAAKSRWLQWQEQGLYLFQLPKYSSQMNPIESEWHQLKIHELVGRMFEDEYELVIAFSRKQFVVAITTRKAIASTS